MWFNGAAMEPDPNMDATQIARWNEAFGEYAAPAAAQAAQSRYQQQRLPKSAQDPDTSSSGDTAGCAASSTWVSGKVLGYHPRHLVNITA